jgi:hypothetical protein
LLLGALALNSFTASLAAQVKGKRQGVHLDTFLIFGPELIPVFVATGFVKAPSSPWPPKTEGDEGVKKVANKVMYIHKTLELLNPILASVPLQLFGYHMAVARACDVDKPP